MEQTKTESFFKTGQLKMKYAFLAALLTVPAVLLVFYGSGRLPGGKYTFLHSDLKTQYTALAKIFWRSLFYGEGIGYTFHLSLGIPSIPLYTFYSLSPFNILYLLIDNVELASIVLVILKLSLSAFTFQRFCAKVLNNDTLSSAVFAVVYALNGYCLIFYLNILYLDGVYMLPLIAVLVAEAVKEQRYVRLSLAYAYIFVVQFYEGYIIGFFSLLFFILLMITEYKKDRKKYVSALVRLGLSVGTAALIGAAFLYPTAIYLLTAPDNHGDYKWIFDCDILGIYRNTYIGQFQGLLPSYPYIYCGIMTLYLVPCFLLDKRIEKKHKITVLILLGFLILCSLWLPAYQFMHCFDEPDGYSFRFSYFYPFILLAVGCAEWKNMDSKRPWKLILLFAVHVAGYFAVTMGEDSTINDKLCNILFLLVFLMLFLFFKKTGGRKYYQIIFLALVYIELIANGMLTLRKDEPDLRYIYQAFTESDQQAVDEIKAYDQEFYRIAQENPYNRNDSSLNNYYGIGYFSTVENIRVWETLKNLGYASEKAAVTDVGGSALTKMIFSQKYEIINNSADYILGRTDNKWIINDRCLSLGFMVSDEILNTVLDSDNAFENQNSLAKGLTGQNIMLFVPYPGEVTGETEHMSVLYNGESFGMVTEEGMTEGSFIFRLEDDTFLPAYAYFSQEASRWVNNAFYFASSEDDRIRFWAPPVISLPRITRLAEDDDGKYFIGIYFDEEHTNYNFYKASYFYCYDESETDKVYELLRDNQMNILEMKGSDITAEVDVTPDKPVLFTSIPYDEGWHILVDGKEAETLSVVDDTFLAVELTAGHHELSFYYSSNINQTGVLLSIAGIMMLLGMMWTEKRNKTIKNKNI